MKVAVTIQHPAHVHFFKHVVRTLAEDGHGVAVYVQEKDVAVDLLTSYGIPHEVLATTAGSRRGSVLQQLRYEYRLFRRLRRFRPDVVTSIAGLEAATVSTATGARSVMFVDSELRQNQLMAPFADAIWSPRNFGMDFGDKHRRYDGFHELAYLHPNRFDPDPDVLRRHGVDPEDPFSVVRFSDMRASHDVGQTGFSAAGKRELLERLDARGTAYVAAEGGSGAFGDRGLPVPPQHLHHLLAFADLVVSDSSTTATEAALLGTPAVRSNSFAGEGDMGNFEELGARYGLVYSTPRERDAIDRCRSILSDPTAGERWLERRDELLDAKIDVVPFVVDRLVAAAPSDARAADGARG